MNSTIMPMGVTAVMLPELDLAEQLALCSSLGVTHYCLRPRIIPEAQRGQPWGNWGNHKFDLTPQRLLTEAPTIRKQIEDAGLTPFGTVPGANIKDNDDDLKLHFDGAAAVGAGRVRVAAPRYPAGVFDYQAELDGVIAGYQRSAALAKAAGVKIVIETHSYSMAASPALAWNIVRHFDPREVSVIFDLPNFAREGELAANLAISVLKPWIDHCHIGGGRRTAGESDALGFRKPGWQMCALSESDLHIPTWLKLMHEADLHPPLLIEDYTPHMPGALRLRRTADELRRVLEALATGGAQ